MKEALRQTKAQRKIETQRREQQQRKLNRQRHAISDEDFRGEIRVLLLNMGEDPFTLRFGDRIAQLVFVPVARAKFEEVKELSQTKRGSGGFGSTGTR